MNELNLQRWFPLLALLGALFAWLFPAPLVPARPLIVPLLGLVMFGMGITLTVDSFAAVLRRPLPVALGVLLQFLLMPLLGWLLSAAFGLAPMLAAGVILLGSCPGGTASNVICYLARGDVALSITLTAVSTLLAVLATPLLTWLYVGERVPVPVAALLLSTVKIVLLPVLLGVLANRWLGRRLAPVRHWFPLLSIAAILFIIAIIVALNHAQLAGLGAGVVLVVAVHNLGGLLLGYWVPRLLKRSRTECRTLAIEVGMQNSGLAVALASQHFAAVAALPGTVFSVWHNLSGAWLASRWGGREPGRRECRHHDRGSHGGRTA